MSTKIPWTQETWNPVVGCSKIAEGCKNCYAEKMAYRLRCRVIYPYSEKPFYAKRRKEFEVIEKTGWTGNIICNDEALEKPLHWRKPKMIFVCSMGDLFHEKVPYSFIYKVLMITQQANWHTYQILTKRIKRAAEILNKFYGTSDGIKWPFENVWLGTSISTQKDDKNISILLQIQAVVRFVSIEPMLKRIDLWKFSSGNQWLIDWVIIGCESGPKARLCSLEDIDYVIDQCKEANVPVFLKQIPLNGKCSKKSAEWPEDLRIQEYPKQGSYGEENDTEARSQKPGV